MTLPPESRPPGSTGGDGWPADVHPNYTGPRRPPTGPVNSAPIPAQADDADVDEVTNPAVPDPEASGPHPSGPVHHPSGAEHPSGPLHHSGPQQLPSGPLQHSGPQQHPSGPLQHPSGPFRPYEQHDDGPWSGAMTTPPPVVVMPRQRPIRQKRSIPVRPIVIAAVALVVLGGLGAWALSSSDDSATPVVTTPTAQPEAVAREKLRQLLPSGYPDAACEPVATPKGALAKFGCERNADTGGPPLATYTLLPDRAALKVAFDDIIRASAVVNCPGSIQSPGAWRRNAAPDKVAGTLFCGFQRDLPTLAWTDDSELMVAAIRGDERGPSLEQLYRWWSSHS
ncbi:hypothetical protein [Mycolicibacterium sediminis]|uniref:Serine/threonine protein kinase n=1 Tax=Mycolicibacterium sediminis TaxID=1286180 RepID=A0A7I7QJ50_9MYCO|nr:hypothetical protein [Mycolicibacterium sediminis]BBY26107.1 hypothetical protein MSEDJ_02030 [Mycolicibacterium sediminis]